MRLIRNSKWEWAFYSGASSAVLMGLIYISWKTTRGDFSNPEWWMSWGPGLIVFHIAFAYILGRRTQRRIDQLQLAMKQAAANNWSVRLPDIQGDAFAETYQDFNAMVAKLESRMKLLQQLGEQRVMEEAPALEAAVQEERRRLARDLHDTVSQQLFALHMASSSLPKLMELDAEQGRKVMEQLIVMSSSAQRQMRGLIAQLRPMELQGRTLHEALDRWFPDYCRQNGLQGTLEIQSDVELTEAKEHQMFLIIQEAMANVVKHADAKEVRLMLGETDSRISLQIEDDGSGFKAEQVRAGTYGLSTMQERAQKLGGEAEIVTKPGSGTRVRVWVPKF
ncbi:sensor histidine kinase LiaS [Cohnella xylanilytica]|uniref:histidine kinase n=1 Tax=Cohnella xylanilytica TaxID=557555 RepID=A0A841U158_9BACL|nr:HAMP domain-containing sensor histidine kinase [Cohnella xylanilytica]MBB6691664.1 HAMP domain-containing sensor histidine kinase [Cohnella xylanilytica]GIO13889.1 sensor histidine kinase LiaS [Cohnella xylanilytica]